MLQHNSFLLPHLEWEAVEFPLLIRELKFERFQQEFHPLSTATVWRDDHLQLKCSIAGRLKSPNALNEVHYVGKGNIIAQDTLRGTDDKGNHIVISGCMFGDFQTNFYTVNEHGYEVKTELIFDTAHIQFITEPEVLVIKPVHCEWYLCDHISPQFWGITYRSLQSSEKKIRKGIDDYDPDFIFPSSKKDFFSLEAAEFSCIVAKVPKELVPNGMEGLCLEFRNGRIDAVDKNLLSDLSSFLSFMLGAKLYYIGSSHLNGGVLKEVLLDSPNIPFNVQPAISPIHYNQQYEWGDFALQVNRLFPVYRQNQDLLSFNHAINRFWTAREIPMGINLPILAGAVEIIANAYLKMTGNNQPEYMSKPAYELLIETELKSLREKLLGVDGGQIMLNKITGAFRKGPNEKITLFFSLLGLEIGQAEKAAINLRNKMTHDKRDYKTCETAFEDIVLTRVYQVLFNRIILTILGYQGYYRDYSIAKTPSKPMEMKIGDT